MLVGFSMIVAVGATWALVGVIFSRAARNGMDFVSLMAVSSILTTLVGSLVFPDYDRLLNEPSRSCFRAAIPMLSAGFIMACGAVLLNKAMRLGHHGATWALAQSALIVPFLFGVIVWGDEVALRNIIGLVIIIVSILFFAFAKDDAEIPEKTNTLHWLILAIATLLFIGAQQTVMTLPSRWVDWTDAARLRVPLIQWGTLIGYNLIVFLQKKRIDWTVWRMAVLLALNIIVSQFILFETLDRFAKMSRAAIVFPVGIGVSMILFSLYSFFIIKEKTTWQHLAGMLAGTIGIIFVALK